MRSVNKKTFSSFFQKILFLGLTLSIVLSPIQPHLVAQAAGVPTNPLSATTNPPAGNTDRAACLSDLSWVGFANCVTGFVYIFTVGLGGAVAWVGATFLNFAVHLSLNSGAYALDFVATGWTTARDIANMAFIFILIYLAITIMFQANTSGTMHTLASVVVVALIINFSFFLTRVVIDAGNILSTQFYNAIIAEGGAAQTNSVVGVIPVPDITAGIMNGVDLQTALSSDSFKSFANSSNNFNDFVPYTIAMSFVFIAVGAMFFMLAASFLTAGVKFLMRIVVLWFMIIASPLALAARASGMRQFEHYYHEWRSNLISHAFYPVAFLFVFWILTQFMGGAGAGGYVTNLFNGLNTTTGNQQDFLIKTGTLIAELGIRLGFVIAMIYIAVQAANRFGTFGASAAEKFGQRFSLGGLAGYTKGLRWAGNRTARIASAPISQPLGSFAALSNSTLRKSGALNRVGLVGDTARGVSKNILQPLTKASFAGEKSYSQLEKEQHSRDHENESRALLDKARKVADPAKDLDDGEKAKINKMSANMFAGIPTRDLERIASVFSEETNKKVHDSQDLSDEVKHAVDHSWHENAGSAPLQKANKMIEELRDINTKLGDLDYTLGTKTEKISAGLATSTNMNKKTLNAMSESLKQKLEEGQVTYEKARTVGDDKAMMAAKTVERNSNEGLKKIEKLVEESGKVPEHIGGQANKGEFNVKV